MSVEEYTRWEFTRVDRNWIHSIYAKRTKYWEKLIVYFPSIWHGPHTKECARIRYSGNVVTEQLPSNNRGIHIETDWWEWCTKYGVEMGSGVIIHTPGLLKISSGIQMLKREIHRQHSDLISLLLFLQNMESMLKIIINKTIMKIVTPLRQQWRQI
jgi:hypothetical protein